MSNTIYPKGVRIFDKHPKQPDFVKGEMVITLNELVKFCKENPDLLSEYKGEKQLKLQITEKKDKSGLNIAVNTYKAEAKTFTNPTDDLPF